MLQSMLVIAGGGATGAVLRWLLSLGLNPLSPILPLGTLTANLLGGYLIGVVLSLLQALPDLNPLWRLFLVTGFLGGLTTFSTFTSEIMLMLEQQRLYLALFTIALHVAGSLLAMAVGIWTLEWWR